MLSAAPLKETFPLRQIARIDVELVSPATCPSSLTSVTWSRRQEVALRRIELLLVVQPPLPEAQDVVGMPLRVHQWARSRDKDHGQAGVLGVAGWPGWSNEQSLIYADVDLLIQRAHRTQGRPDASDRRCVALLLPQNDIRSKCRICLQNASDLTVVEVNKFRDAIAAEGRCLVGGDRRQRIAASELNCQRNGRHQDTCRQCPNTDGGPLCDSHEHDTPSPAVRVVAPSRPTWRRVDQVPLCFP